jgi:hypothetical protein
MTAGAGAAVRSRGGASTAAIRDRSPLYGKRGKQVSEEVVVEHDIVIARPQSIVFGFAAEYENDPQWRAEVKRMEYAKPLRVGATLVEHAEFQGQELETRTTITEWEPPTVATAETTPDAPHHLISVRTVTAIDETTARLTYRLVFDREALRPVMPELPPAEEISAWYGSVVQSYLETLKKLIENDSAR